MIKSKKDLKKYLDIESQYYRPKGIYNWIKSFLAYDKKFLLWKYIKYLRKTEYYFYEKNKKKYLFINYIFYLRKKNKLSYKLGIEIDSKSFDSGLTIYHSQGIVVNGDAKIGKNCQLHGANVIGNMGNRLETPVIGDNVRLGAGAKVLGDVYIADGVQIGAGAIVLKSCYEKNALLVGIPAKVYNRGDK